jgi:hypothetical protein
MPIPGDAKSKPSSGRWGAREEQMFHSFFHIHVAQGTIIPFLQKFISSP